MDCLFLCIKINCSNYNLGGIMKNGLRMLSVVSAVFLVVSCSLGSFAFAAAAEKPTEVRFSAYYPDSYPVYKEGIAPWMKMVEKESNGQFVFKNYLNAVLHTVTQGFRAAMTDITDLTHAYPYTQPASFNLSHAYDLPFALRNSHAGALIVETLYPKYMKEEYEKMGVYCGFWAVTSLYSIITKKPIQKLADLKGLKIRSPGGYASEILEALGAVPVIVAGPELYTAFQNGVVDGQMHMDPAIVTYKLQEIGKYILHLDIARVGVPYALNKKFFDSLTPEKKRFFYNKLRQGAQMAALGYAIDDQNAKKVLKEQNIVFSRLSDGEMEVVRKAVEAVQKKFITANEAKGLPVKQLLEDIRVLNEKYKDLTQEQAMEMVTKNPIQGIINF